MKNIASALGCVILLLAGDALAAMVVSPSKAGTSILASALIDSGGNVIGQDGDWVSSVSVTTGRYQMSIKPGTFVRAPRCTANLMGFPLPGSSVTVNPDTGSIVVIITASDGSGGFALTPAAYQIMCEGDSPQLQFKISPVFPNILPGAAGAGPRPAD